jgi:hypothetical protein
MLGESTLSPAPWLCILRVTQSSMHQLAFLPSPFKDEHTMGASPGYLKAQGTWGHQSWVQILSLKEHWLKTSLLWTSVSPSCLLIAPKDTTLNTTSHKKSHLHIQPCKQKNRFKQMDQSKISASRWTSASAMETIKEVCALVITFLTSEMLILDS